MLRINVAIIALHTCTGAWVTCVYVTGAPPLAHKYVSRRRRVDISMGASENALVFIVLGERCKFDGLDFLI